jgi:hypothetical protein
MMYPLSSNTDKAACTVEVEEIPVASQISLTVGGKDLLMTFLR